MTTPPTPQDAAYDAIFKISEEAWGSPPDAAGRQILARYADAVLAAVEPVIRQQVAEEIAAKLNRYRPRDKDMFLPGWMHFDKAAAIARSHATREEQDHG